jgi:hypothetical protein
LCPTKNQKFQISTFYGKNSLEMEFRLQKKLIYSIFLIKLALFFHTFKKVELNDIDSSLSDRGKRGINVPESAYYSLSIDLSFPRMLAVELCAAHFEIIFFLHFIRLFFSQSLSMFNLL